MNWPYYGFDEETGELINEETGELIIEETGDVLNGTDGKDIRFQSAQEAQQYLDDNDIRGSVR